MTTFVMKVFRKIPLGFLPIARIKTREGTATLRKDGWVIISDGKVTDALPVVFCSDAIIKAFTKEFT